MPEPDVGVDEGYDDEFCPNCDEELDDYICPELEPETEGGEIVA